MRGQSFLWWVSLLLLPLIPVAILYAFFEGQNFFELENTAKGILATGPIAAYIVIVLVGLRLFKSVTAKEPKLSDSERRLLKSKWVFDSESRSGKKRKGSFRVSAAADSELQLQGNFETIDGKAAGDWVSTMARSADGLLQIVYELNDSDEEGKVQKSTGMISLHAKDDSDDEMSGKWVLLGRENTGGEMSCRRVKKKAKA